MAQHAHTIRLINPQSEDEINLVAQRMRQTLIEVLGEERGVSLYTLEWLRERVLFHLDSQKSSGQIFLAENGSGHITGHTIVRIEIDTDGKEFGLFSTTFVEQESRKHAIASSLLLRGEEWMLEQGMTMSATYTSIGNEKLIKLYQKHGYKIAETSTEMLRLAKQLTEN